MATARSVLVEYSSYAPLDPQRLWDLSSVRLSLVRPKASDLCPSAWNGSYHIAVILKALLRRDKWRKGRAAVPQPFKNMLHKT